MRNWVENLISLAVAFLAASCVAQPDPRSDVSERVPGVIESIEFFEQRLNSPIWQIRYCLLGDLDRGTQEEKAILEKLISDESRNVRNQALVRYIRNYVEIDRKLVEERLEDFYAWPPRAGIHRQTQEMRSVEFHKQYLQTSSFPRLSESIELVGILGTTDDVDSILAIREQSNPHILNLIANALYRLGDKESAILVFEKVLSLEPDQGGIWHQLRTVSYLSQIDLALARDKYSQLEESLDNVSDMNPGRIHELTLTGWRLERAAKFGDS